MAITYALIKVDDAGNAHTHVRSTYARGEATEMPDWVTALMSGGGVHDLTTCESCALSAMARKAVAEFKGRSLIDGKSDKDYFRRVDEENERNALEEYKRFSGDDLEADYARQNERYVRQAERAAVKRLPTLIRELQRMSDVAGKQAGDASLSRVQVKQALLRYFACGRAIAIAQERLDKVSADPVDAARLRMLTSV